MRLQRIIWFIFLLESCVNSQLRFPDSPAISGIAIPIRMELDTTILSLTDYFPIPERLTNFRLPSGIEGRQNGSRLALFAVNSSGVLDNLRFRYEKYDYDIPIFQHNALGVVDSVLLIRTESFQGDTIFLRSSKKNVHWQVYLQNYKLKDKFLYSDDTLLKLVIPNEVETLEQSSLRIWAFDDKSLSNGLIIPLQKRQVITAAADLKQVMQKCPEGKVPVNRKDKDVLHRAVSTFSSKKESFKLLNHSLLESFARYGVYGEKIGRTDSITYFISYSPVKKNEVELGMAKLDCSADYDRLLQLLVFNATIPMYGKDGGVADSINDVPMNSGDIVFQDSLRVKKEATIKKSILLDHLSNELIALVYGDFLPLRVEDQVYAYLRSYFDREVIVVFNKSSEPITLKLDLPRRERVRSFNALWRGRFSYDNSKIIMDLPANGVEVIYN